MAYSFQSFGVGDVLTASQMNQVETNIADHVHGQEGVADNQVSAFYARDAVQRVGNSGNDFTVCSFTVTSGSLLFAGRIRVRAVCEVTGADWQSGGSGLDLVLKYGATDVAKFRAGLIKISGESGVFAIDAELSSTNSLATNQLGALGLDVSPNGATLDATSGTNITLTAASPSGRGGTASENSAADLGFSIVASENLSASKALSVLFWSAEKIG